MIYKGVPKMAKIAPQEACLREHRKKTRSVSLSQFDTNRPSLYIREPKITKLKESP